MIQLFTFLRHTICGLILIFGLYGCSTTTTDETVAVYDNPSATKLTNKEITELIVGNAISLPKWSGIISYFQDGNYTYRQGGKTRNSSYRIENDRVCIYKNNGDQILCAEYYLLAEQYYWSNAKNRKWTSVVSSIVPIDG